jgi:hypothetical protein
VTPLPSLAGASVALVTAPQVASSNELEALLVALAALLTRELVSWLLNRRRK